MSEAKPVKSPDLSIQNTPKEDTRYGFERKKPRFPFPAYPTGWFAIGQSSRIKSGEVQALRYFGEDLVLFRSESGELSLLDAFCPHLGAHLGHRGKVCGNVIRCPFHAWEFNGKGECTKVPYAKKIPPKAKIPAWHIREHSGLIFAWFHIDKCAPLWEIPEVPEFDDDKWTPPASKEWTIRTHNQEMAENIADTAHFKYLHGAAKFPEGTVNFEGHRIHMVTETAMTTPMGPVMGQVESNSWGFGFSTNRFTGIVETLLMGCVTPIDDEYVHVQFIFTVKKFGGRSIMDGVGKAFVTEISRQLEQDKAVWERKVYFDRPILCDGDGPIGKLRKWGKQFYPEWYAKQAREEYERVHGPIT